MDLNKERVGLEKNFYGLCSSLVKDQGLSLYDVEYLPSQHLLRLYIMDDKTKNATLDDCIKVDHALTPYVESEAWMPESLTLEVSSPGVYRHLNCSEHFLMAQEKDIKLELYKPVDENEYVDLPKRIKGQKKLRVFLEQVLDDGLAVNMEGYKMVVPFEQIKKAFLDPDLNKIN